MCLQAQTSIPGDCRDWGHRQKKCLQTMKEKELSGVKLNKCMDESESYEKYLSVSCIWT